ncbi:MAG: dipeptide epimerase [Pseudomonadota bacterium]
MELIVETVVFDLKEPFSITGHTFSDSGTVRVTLKDGGHAGRGEASGVYYLNETPETMTADLERVRRDVEGGATRQDIQTLLSAGGARNALDCAYWDLEAKKQGRPVSALADLGEIRPLTTVYTITISDAETMARNAASAAAYPHLKIKLDDVDVMARMEAIRAARPDASLVIDVNQGWNFDQLKEYAPQMEKLGVAMIEQPMPRGGDAELEGYKSPVPLGGDESCLHTGEYVTASKRYDVINIKLDKTGGLTEAIKLADQAEADGKWLMVGNMVSSSLSMAPAFLIGQRCRFVDLDGPLFLKHDVEPGLEFGEGGTVAIPSTKLWG